MMKTEITKEVFSYITKLRNLWPHESNKSLIESKLVQILNTYYQWHEALVPKEIANIENDVVLKKSLALLDELSENLVDKSIPWPSHQYLAHMNTDVLMSSCLAYFTTMLYNPNNVTPEASPVTTKLEYELSDAFCHLFGFDSKIAWAHLSSGGHSSNYEAIWMARNLKKVPFVIKDTPQLADLLKDIPISTYTNLAPSLIADLLEKTKERGLLVQLLENINKFTYCPSLINGRLLVANGRHYAWDKCANLLCLQLELIELDQSFRMDINALQKKIDDLLTRGEPIVAVVATVGSSGEGSVDEVHKIIELREHYEKQLGYSFYIHVDAAFGGYYRSLLVEPVNHEETLCKVEQDPSIFLKSDVKKALKALESVDSITVDPHKSGYVPYPAGCLVISNRWYSSVISIQSKYFDQTEGNYMDFGPYTLEGARPGAAIAAVWMSHRLLGFHNQGYGMLLAGNIMTANNIHSLFSNNDKLIKQIKLVHLQSIYSPDLSMLNFTLQHGLSNNSPSIMDKRNKQFIEYFYNQNSEEPWFSKNLIPSKHLLVDTKEDSQITVIRCCVMKTLNTKDLENFEKYCKMAIRKF